jgi:hypothetical protein
MNITPQAPSLSIPTVLNPHTETLRRENNQREVISQPAALAQSAAEKGVASDKERGRTPAQNNEGIDFASLKEKAELANNAIAEKGGQQDRQQQNQEEPSGKDDSSAKNQEDSQERNNSEGASEELQQARVISELQSRDREVRSHELAHAAVGGAFTGSPSYSFQIGPDGRKYAVEGEVSVDLSSVPGDPRATISKMQKIHAAALAPANPSVQDSRVAASAAQIIQQAQSELSVTQGNEFARARLENSAFVSPNSTLAENEEAVDKQTSSAQDFDALIDKTLKAQEQISPSRSEAVSQRAVRIENFYSNITQAYEKPANYQFELTA